MTTRFVAAGDPALDEIAALLSDRFPPGERDDWAHLAGRHEAGHLVIAAVEQPRPAPGPGFVPAQATSSTPRPGPRRLTRVNGAAVVALLPRTGSAALLYLASHRDAPTAGVGLHLMSHLRTALPEYGVTRGFLGEVERVEDAADPGDALLRRRRLHYYQRFGAQLVEALPGYGMPDMTTGALLPLHLVWLPAGTPLVQVTGQLLRDLVTELYEVAYERADDDPLLAQVLASARSAQSSP
ncbi:MAG: hypothetical protein ACXVWU_06905 [Nocardioides sp.]